MNKPTPIPVIQIGTGEIGSPISYLLDLSKLNYLAHYKLNGKPFNEALRYKTVQISEQDLLTYRTPNKQITHYQKENVNGELSMISIQEWQSKPQYFPDGAPNEDILRAVANREELKGFEAVYELPLPQQCSFEVIAYMEYTGSRFIESYIKNQSYGNSEAIYTVHGQAIALNEWYKLKEKFSTHGTFSEDTTKGRVQFFKVNGKGINRSWRNQKPFGDSEYINTYPTLKEAQDEEVLIRGKVREAVMTHLFPKEFTVQKATTLIKEMRTILKLKSKVSKNESIALIIDELQEYIDQLPTS